MAQPQNRIALFVPRPPRRRRDPLRRDARPPGRGGVGSPHRHRHARRLRDDEPEPLGHQLGPHAGGPQAAAMIGATYHCLDERDLLVVYDKPTIAKAMDLFRRVAPSLVLTHRAERLHAGPRAGQPAGAGRELRLRCAEHLRPARCRPGCGVPYLYYCDPIEGDRPARQRGPADDGHRHHRASRRRSSRCSPATPASASGCGAHHGIDEYLEMTRRHDAEARRSGSATGAAEAFVQHRGHAYPADDLLREMFA